MEELADYAPLYTVRGVEQFQPLIGDVTFNKAAPGLDGWKVLALLGLVWWLWKLR